MKLTVVLAALVAASVGSIGVGAAVPNPYQGSDTLFALTTLALTAPQSNIGPTTGLSYVGGGSGAGENAMTAATPSQSTAPMTSMLGSQTCKVPAPLSFTNASGIAIGLDAVDVYSSWAAGGVGACNGASGPGGDNTGFGLRYSSGAGAGDGGPYLNWTDVLALLYGGMNKGASLCVGGTQAGLAC